MKVHYLTLNMYTICNELINLLEKYGYASFMAKYKGLYFSVNIFGVGYNIKHNTNI